MKTRSLLITAWLAAVGAVGILNAQSTSIEARELLFSGAPDPQIVFTSSSDIDSLRPFLTGLPTAAEPTWPVSGFRGFLLLNSGVSDFPLDVTVFEGVIRIFDGSTVSFFQDVHGLQQRLQSIFGSSSGVAASNAVPPANADPAAPNANAGLPTSGSEPPFSPSDWNSDAFTQRHNNCYNYACNKRTDTYAQPGKAANRIVRRPYTCSAVLAASLWDGRILWIADIPCPRGCYKVALVVDPGTKPLIDSDYHWLRQDQGGNWSQKFGGGPAINVDVAGKPITDPRNPPADNGSYTDFCGFYCVAADPDLIDISSLWYRPLLGLAPPLPPSSESGSLKTDEALISVSSRNRGRDGN